MQYLQYIDQLKIFNTYPIDDFATGMHLVQHGGRLSGQTVQLLVQIRLADGQ